MSVDGAGSGGGVGSSGSWHSDAVLRRTGAHAHVQERRLHGGPRVRVSRSAIGPEVSQQKQRTRSHLTVSSTDATEPSTISAFRCSIRRVCRLRHTPKRRFVIDSVNYPNVGAGSRNVRAFDGLGAGGERLVLLATVVRRHDHRSARGVKLISAWLGTPAPTVSPLHALGDRHTERNGPADGQRARSSAECPARCTRRTPCRRTAACS